ncbi:molybdate transport system substrate-binding protein [Melghirimyces profundicolus]|uniref:Molybdate transport system substrate-binding protein n=1 Tax=Melghirimyces profundicolus TaxID=1242148 RepID=A0A2T6BXL8_9BACL|nr:molybdate ABC transporter substrate-binding protein [Melghirimyces profundicolus]PTX60820.1 molybdate transport system substrate-binding protein [Melghirimyces profundicolus]
MLKRGSACLLAVWFCAFSLFGCAPENERREVVVLAASSLTDALGELEKKYEAEHPGLNLVISFASSGKLRQQIEQGAPADIFFSAGSLEMDKLENGGKIVPSTRVNLLTNELVLIVPQQGESGVKRLEDLRSENVKKLAIGEPGVVPAGRYAKEFLTRTGRWNDLRPKLVFGANVRQVLSYVESGNADAGLVYKSDTYRAEGVKEVGNIPLNLYSPIVYPVSVVRDAKNPKQAKDFLRWLKGNQRKAVFEKYGFKGEAFEQP